MTPVVTAPARGTRRADQLFGSLDGAFPRPRRILQIVLGAIWLLDGALQFQSFMYTSDFPNQVMRPTGEGSPGFVSGPVTWASDLFVHHLVLLNTFAAVLQLAIGAGMIYKRTTRIAIIVSIPWALGVWWMGEGMGMMFGEPVSPLMGLPGAVLLYAIIGLMLYPRADSVDGPSVGETGLIGASAPKVLWTGFWLLAAGESLRPTLRASSWMSQMVSGMTDSQPSWLVSLENSMGNALAGRGLAATIVLVVACLIIAAAVWLPRLRRPGLILALVTAAFIWVFGEALGGILTGAGTDPNSGPLLALWAVTFWPLASTMSHTSTSEQLA
jgi:hypothetical protein